MEAPLPERPPTPMTLPLLLTGIVNPGAHRTLVSERLTFPYIIDSITISFPIGADHLVEVTPILSQDPSVSIVAPPVGNFLLGFCSVTPSIVGDDASFRFPMSFHVAARGTWIKCHLYNGDAFMHRVSALFSLTEILRR